MTQSHRNHRLLDSNGHPVRTEDIDILALPQIEREALDGIPDSMEGRLFHKPPLEPAVVLLHPLAEVYVLIRLTDLGNLQYYVDQVNTAVLRQAMGEPPPDAQGYPTKG